ncbi:hypothetical protein [Altererythrobacter aquiaggeris]|uniref:hypothetical protein n=1 Tax=Aestuarierythrobacter aquiaggeris TaxID=1898396 RepID=UPI0030169588
MIEMKILPFTFATLLLLSCTEPSRNVPNEEIVAEGSAETPAGMVRETWPDLELSPTPSALCAFKEQDPTERDPSLKSEPGFSDQIRIYGNEGEFGGETPEGFNIQTYIYEGKSVVVAREGMDDLVVTAERSGVILSIGPDEFRCKLYNAE